MGGCYWLVYAPTAGKAKGAILARNHQRTFQAIQCRRWRILDHEYTTAAVMEWGYPGMRDQETGAYISTPEPFLEVAE